MSGTDLIIGENISITDDIVNSPRERKQESCFIQITIPDDSSENRSKLNKRLMLLFWEQTKSS